MRRFQRAAHQVDAMLFDGTPDGAATIAAAFYGIVRHGEGLMVSTAFGRVYVGAGCWIVQDLATRALRALEDREFTAAYEPLPVATPTTAGFAP